MKKLIFVLALAAMFMTDAFADAAGSGFCMAAQRMLIDGWGAQSAHKTIASYVEREVSTVDNTMLNAGLSYKGDGRAALMFEMGAIWHAGYMDHKIDAEAGNIVPEAQVVVNALTVIGCNQAT